MEYITIHLKTFRKDLTGFNKDNQYMLKFNVSSGSTVQNLLDNFNAHRRPSKHIRQLYNNEGIISNERVLKENTTFMVK